MHVNFGVTNGKLSNVLALDRSKYAIALSYAKCDSDYHFDYNSDQIKSTHNNSSDDGYKETTLEESDDINRKISLSDDFDQNKEILEDEKYKSYAIRVQSLNFSYKKLFLAKEKANKILQNCSIRVIEANIYALLGSSGCGKTTLLKCILGRLRPDSGDVRIFGDKPNTLESTIPGINLNITKILISM